MKYIFLLAFISMYVSLLAQTSHVNEFKEGFEFTVNRVENTNAYIRYNESVLDLNYRVTVDRNYAVTSSNNGRFVVKATTQNVIDTLETEGKVSVYTSSTTKDNSSEIQAAIDSLVKNPAEITLDAGWLVSSAHKVPESLPALFGVYSGIQRKGEKFMIFPDFTIDTSKEVGYKWHEERNNASGGNQSSDYEIVTGDAGYFTVQYSRTIVSDDINANESGIVIVERATGFIIESNVKTISRSSIEFRGRSCMLEKWTDVVQLINPLITN